MAWGDSSKTLRTHKYPRETREGCLLFWRQVDDRASFFSCFEAAASYDPGPPPTKRTAQIRNPLFALSFQNTIDRPPLFSLSAAHPPPSGTSPRAFAMADTLLPSFVLNKT